MENKEKLPRRFVFLSGHELWVEEWSYPNPPRRYIIKQGGRTIEKGTRVFSTSSDAPIVLCHLVSVEEFNQEFEKPVARPGMEVKLQPVDSEEWLEEALQIAHYHGHATVDEMWQALDHGVYGGDTFTANRMRELRNVIRATRKN